MARKSGNLGKTAIWILMAMLIFGLGGFGITGLSGTVRSIGTVGDQDIPIDDYARNLQQEIRAIEAQLGQPLDFAQAREFGIDAAVLQRLVAEAALDNETARIGLSVSDATLAKQIRDIPDFQGPSGFDRDTYAFALQQNGMTEAEFENGLREETARTLLQGAVVSGLSMPQAYSDALVGWLAERRDFTFIRLDMDDLTAPLPTPGEDQLKTYHQDNIIRFTAPEKKRLTYAWLSPAMVLDTVQVDEAQLRRAYDARESEYNTPERRLVERLAFPSEEAASAVRSAIDTGDQSFEDAVAERGLDLADVDLGDVAHADLDASADAVFAAEVGQVVGPFDSSVGPALFRVNGVLEPQAMSFEEARPRLRDELAGDEAVRHIATQIDPVDDLLAGGATLEELAAETELELGSIDWHDNMGEGVAGYPAFRAAAANVTADDYPEVIELEDGGIVALRFEEIIEPEILPLDQVRDEVIAGWQSDETERQLTARAEVMAARLREGADFSGLDLGREATVLTDQMRNQTPLGTPIGFMAKLFDLQEGDVLVHPALGAVILARLDAVKDPDLDSPRVAALLEQLNEESANSLAQDIYNGFATRLRIQAGVQLDDRAINAVHANFQ